MKAGAVDFLTRPINQQALLDAVFVALERDRRRQAQVDEPRCIRERFRDRRDRLERALSPAATPQLAQEGR